MRNTRKWLVLLLAFVMLVSNLSIPAAAVETESPIELALAAGSGSETQVQILAAEAQTVADGKLVLTYDAEVLTWLSAEPGDAWGQTEFFTWSHNPNAGEIILTFASAGPAAKGVLFTLSFEGIADTVVAIDGSSYITGVEADLAQELSTCPSARFTDLGGLSEQAHAAIDFMVAKGYIVGVSNTAFAPRGDLNRAMLVTILHRIDGSPAPESNASFTDVPEGKYFTNAVSWAYANGITMGVSEHLFAPERTLTRQELATFLYRFAKLHGKDMSASADLSNFDDADRIQPYALEAFQWAVANGIIMGTSDTTLEPRATTNRAQLAMMVHRMLSAWE